MRINLQLNEKWGQDCLKVWLKRFVVDMMERTASGILKSRLIMASRLNQIMRGMGRGEWEWTEGTSIPSETQDQSQPEAQSLLIKKKH